MENTETPIVTEQTPVSTEETTTTTTVPVVETVTEETPIVNGEVEPVTENVETTNTETIPPTESTTTEVVEEETTKPTDEQENVTDTNAIVPPTSLSPGRVNVPLKEVNESEKEEAAVIPNGTENGISKKRELEQEDEPTEETTTDNDERNGNDQIKKIKTSETIDTPIIETKEPENNIIVNGNTAVEV